MKECNDEPKAVVLIVHGLGEHCHRYDRLINHLNNQNVRVYSFDHRGHGRTHNLPTRKQGSQGHIDSDKRVVMEDIGQLMERAGGDGIGEEIPKYLLGHSLGGLMVIYYALTENERLGITGLIAVAPAIGVCRPPNKIIRSLAPLAAKIIPTMTIEGDIRLHEISRLPEVLAALEADDLMHRKVSFGTGKVILEMCKELEEEEQPEINVPCLFIHGTADKITE